MCSKNTLPSKHEYLPPFPVKLHKNDNYTTLSIPLSKQSRLRFHVKKLCLFRPFLFSSKLDHTTCSDLLLVIEARRLEDQFQFTERSFADCNK